MKQGTLLQKAQNHIYTNARTLPPSSRISRHTSLPFDRLLSPALPAFLPIRLIVPTAIVPIPPPNVYPDTQAHSIARDSQNS